MQKLWLSIMVYFVTEKQDLFVLLKKDYQYTTSLMFEQLFLNKIKIFIVSFYKTVCKHFKFDNHSLTLDFKGIKYFDKSILNKDIYEREYYTRPYL